jgi:hypothetical protein
MTFNLKWAGTVFFSVLLNLVFSQERALGTWKVFMPYGNSLGVCDAGDKIYSTGLQTIFSYEKSTGVIQVYDKATGLNDVGIKAINYDPSTKFLVIAYNNSNVDIIYNGTDIYNISDIKAENVSGSVGINGISFYNGSCYLSTDAGISVISLAKKEISNTYIIGSTGSQVKVFATSTDGNYIYAATAEGVKRASLSTANLLDFNSWYLFNVSDSMPTQRASLVTAYNNKIYAVISSNGTDTLYEYSSNSWRKIYADSAEIFSSMKVVNGTLYFSIWDNNNGTSGKLGKIDASGNLALTQSQGHARPLDWFEDNGVNWEADLYNGLFKNVQGNLTSIAPDGPFSNRVYKLDVKDGILYVAPGGVDDSWAFTYNMDGFFVYDGVKWDNYTIYNHPELNQWFDVISVTSVPAMGKTYFGSFYGGLIEYNNANKTFTQHDQYNDPFWQPAFGDEGRTKVSASTLDANGNVWFSNAGAAKPVKIIKPDGSRKDFEIPIAFSLIKRITVDRNGQLWMPIRGSGGGMIVWSYNGTLDDESDDKTRLLTTGAGNGGLPDANVYCAAEDNDGNIWVGTNQGIAVYYCAGSVFTGCDADLIKVERDGYIGYLFSTESIRIIVVDAANRKWIGTTNGLWLISADGKTELLKFTIDNSPLPTNQITDIAINDKTGEVFIGTTGGLVSYKGDAIADCSDCNEALVYPNPVKPDYTGPIAIKGLVENAYVKITDVTGTLVYQGRANGTQMIWDGKGYNGSRAKSGVYMVFSSTDLGKEKRIAKILLTN